MYLDRVSVAAFVVVAKIRFNRHFRVLRHVFADAAEGNHSFWHQNP